MWKRESRAAGANSRCWGRSKSHGGNEEGIRVLRGAREICGGAVQRKNRPSGEHRTTATGRGQAERETKEDTRPT